MASVGGRWEALSHLYTPSHIPEGDMRGPVQPLVRRALLAIKLRDWAAAARQLDLALAILPRSRELLDTRAGLGLDHAQAAQAAFRKALALEAGCAEAASGLRVAEELMAAQPDRRSSLQF
ncbi:hypothetical protein QBZ16_005359 [Prototheca wickerhamii]|uniref:Uncharacterized protein n=1 Tax=Prototheca wickerhamii TaxID=3111 RepID=A0AAD9IGA5_PROWI|nr:hypothetical protein QBZ16_005359 [Prototheca wickerhamii]